MKRLRTFLLLLTLIFCVQGAVPAARVQAAAKSGLIKENGKYYYYAKGKKVKKTWKTVKVGSRSYRYYFGSNGAAYAGKSVDGEEIPALKTVGSARYAFSSKGRMLTEVQLINGKFYYFSSNGKYSSAKTSKLRKAAKDEASFSTLKKLLKSYGAKPKKIEYYDGSCYVSSSGETGMDGTAIYSNFEVGLFKTTKGKVLVMGVWPRVS